MIDKVKGLLGIELLDDSKDIILNVYIDRAILSIRNYVNNDRFTNELIVEDFEVAIITLVETAYKMRNNKYVKSYSQGARSETFKDDFGINDEIKSLLPKPYMRVM